MDTESLKSMLPLLEGQHVLLAAIGGNAGHQHSINNGFMASRPSESFWMFYLNGMVAQFANQTLMVCPCWQCHFAHPDVASSCMA